MARSRPTDDPSPAPGVPSPAPRAYHIAAHRVDVGPADPGLHLVSTPIGNLSDITLRALETLAGVDVIVCEDTRVTRVLLDRYGLKAPLSAYHEHNAARERPKLLAKLAEGKAIALVSDAGTPLISDPGYKLVVDAVAAGHKVIPVPGASALLAGLVVAGLPTDRFVFVGFAPTRTGDRRRLVESLKPIDATLVFYESPRRVGEFLGLLADILGPDRPASVSRELTKKFEETARGTLADLATRFAAHEPKGEIVVVVGPPAATTTDAHDVDRLLRAALETQSTARAAAEVARLTGADRKALYERALALKEPSRADTGDEG
jgi:16S rRNA (cytidine1402-2'-O)-methyltransferase